MKQISLHELEQYLNKLLDAASFEESAYNGVQVATKAPITRIATAVSVTLEVINKAIADNAQALVVHHGIFRKGDHPTLVGRSFDYIQLLIKHDIALLCYHLPLDADHTVGNNWGAAAQLQLQNCKPFLMHGGKQIGVIGDTQLSFDALVQKASALYNKQPCIVKMHDQIKKVAIVSGGADRFITEAAQSGADCFITGRVDERVWQDAHEYNISFLSFGHYATETIGPKLLAHKLQNDLAISAHFIATDNPF